MQDTEGSSFAIQLSDSTTFNNQTTKTVNLTNFHTISAQKFPQMLVLKNYASYLVLKVCVEVIESQQENKGSTINNNGNVC
jgi:hypothetical protein